MATLLTIYNMALGHIGQKTQITDVTESPHCELYYPTARDSCLTWATWTFATIRQQLTMLPDSTMITSNFAHQYLLPTQPPVLRTIDIDTQTRPFQREIYIDRATPDTQQPVLLTDADEVVLRYIGQISEGVFPPLFTACLALWLASDISQTISRKASLRQELFAELQVKLQALQRTDAHQDWPQEQVLDERYIAARGVAGDLVPFTGLPIVTA